MQKPADGKQKRRIWPWIISIVLGAAIGYGGARGLLMLRAAHTSVTQMMKPPFNGQKFVRILALGEDNTHKSSATGRGLSDTILVVAVDMDKKTVRGLSVPRDTMIEIPGHGTRKINAAYSIGGPELAVNTVQGVLGVKIDYYMQTDIAGLKNIVDLIGGVGIDVEKNMHYTDRRGGLYINLRKGYRHLNGDQALQYVRFRHDKLGDITRIQRQQKFLRAIARHMLEPRNLVHAPAVVGEIYEKGYVKTNLNLKDLKALIELARDIPPDKMEMEMASGAPQNIDGASYWVIDTIKTSEQVAKLLLPGGGNLAPSVEVLNGSGTAGLAKQVSDQLQTLGYRVISTGNANGFNYERSQITARAGMEDKAREIAPLIGNAEVKTAADSESTSGSADITVIIGKNYKQ
ncbi:MAG: LCP family protein [Armatimonadota bacterium]